MFQYSKLQFCCLIIAILLGCIYKGEIRRRGKLRAESNTLFNVMILIGYVEILFDGITAYTVNQDWVPRWINLGLHLVFYMSLLGEVFMYYIYILRETDAYPTKVSQKLVLYTPSTLIAIMVIIGLPEVQFNVGEYTRYSMGGSVIVCFAAIFIYVVLTLILLIRKYKYISKLKQANIVIVLCVVFGFLVTEAVFHESLLTSCAILMLIVSVYLTQENPLYRELRDANNEMVMGFATLIENRDDSTGGHVKRTSAYVNALALELKKRGIYARELTSDYIRNLTMAAPVHDIGKIAIPDVILQSPGKLTAEEYDVMKTHTIRGAKIIESTFSNTSNRDYSRMAYDVVLYHHEKWDGTGYPKGLKGLKIPLSARIMAVADVFDAIAEKRCYKEAKTLEESFAIVKAGAGSSFDPVLVDVFLSIRNKIETIHNKICSEKK